MKKIISFILLSTFLFGAQPKFLMPEEAFKPVAKLNDKMQIEAVVGTADEIYLYESALKLEIVSKNGISVKDITSPKTIKHEEDNIYKNSPKFVIDLKKDQNATGILSVELKLSYQGCSEQGLCYEPESRIFKFDIDSSKLGDGEAKSTLLKKIDEKNTTKDLKLGKEKLSESDTIADSLKNGNMLLVLLTFFGFGLLLSLTPCVFPMIPIISGIIISHGEGLTTKKAFILSVIYVFAMAIAYTIAGVLAGLFGSNLQSALQNPIVIYSFSAIFVALALSMFGFYELKLPDQLVAKVSSNNNRSGFVGIAIMGFFSALIVGPCVAAPLAGALVYIGQTGDALLGGMALFSMSIGMGAPLIIVGVSAGRFMPKPGAWMTMISAIFGVMMLAVAVWMLERVVDNSIIVLLYSMLGISFGLYLGAFENSAHIFRRSVGMIIFIYSVTTFVGLMGGSGSMTKPLEFLKQSTQPSSTKQTSQEVKFIKVSSIKELDAVLAKNHGKKIMLDFSAKWCTSCKELDEITFADERVKAKMGEFVLVRADITDNTQEQKDLSKKYGVFGPPAIIFFDKDLNIISSKTIIGFIEADNFLEALNTI